MAPDGALAFLNHLWLPDEVRELRIPRHNVYGHTASGYFDSPEKLAVASKKWGTKANLYVSLNPVLPPLLARAANRVLDRARNTTSDQHVSAAPGSLSISIRTGPRASAAPMRNSPRHVPSPTK